MADHRLRAAMRNDPDKTRGRTLTECLRAGTLTGERVELAAYCGHEGAREISDLARRYIPCTACSPTSRARCASCAGDGWTHEGEPHELPLDFWTRGLARWGKPVMVRAAWAAAAVALPVWTEANPPETGANVNAPAFALAACRAWLDEPTEERREAWRGAMSDDLPTWIPAPPRVATSWIAWVLRRFSAERAARVASPEAVRERIQEELISWALKTNM